MRRKRSSIRARAAAELLSFAAPRKTAQLRTPKEMAAYLDTWLADAPDDAAGIARAL